MTNLVFAFMQAYGGDERESLLLVRSLRKFGGELANQPLWLMVPRKLEHISESTRQALRGLDVQVHRFEVPEDALKFPFGGKVYAAAAAEVSGVQSSRCPGLDGFGYDLCRGACRICARGKCQPGVSPGDAEKYQFAV